MFISGAREHSPMLRYGSWKQALHAWHPPTLLAYSHPSASFPTNGQQSAAKGSSTTVSRSDIRLIQHLDSSALGLIRRWRLTGYFLILYYPSASSELLCPHSPTTSP
jgi:hypothetical protein